MGKSNTPAFQTPSRPAYLQLGWRRTLEDSAAMIAWAPPDFGLPCLGVATFSGHVHLLERETGHLLHSLQGHAQGALALAFQAQGVYLATAGQDGEIEIFSPSQSQSLRFKANPDDPKRSPVSMLSWSSDGQVLASACGRMVRFWSPQGELLSELPEHPSTVTALCFSEAFGGFFSASYGSVRFTARASLEIERELWFRTSILSLAPSPCGRYIAAGTQDPLVRIWDWCCDAEAVNLEGYSGKTPIVVFSGETLILATASGSSAVLWSFAFGNLRSAPHAALLGPTRRVSGLEFLQEGKALLSSSLDGQLRLYELTSAGTTPSASLNLQAPLHLLSLSPDRRYAIAAGTDASIHSIPLNNG